MAANPQDDLHLDQEDIEVPVTEYRPVPEGLYEVELINVERTSTQFGEGVKLIYRIAEGPETDTVVDEIAGLKGGRGSKLKERLDALRGQPHRPGEVLRPRQLFGARARAYVITKEVLGQDGVPFTVNRINRLTALAAPAVAPPGATPTRENGTPLPPAGRGSAAPRRVQAGPQEEPPDEAWGVPAPARRGRGREGPVSETVQTRTAALVDEGIWDVPGVGLVKGKHLTLEYAKLALALYGARERVLRRLAARLLHALGTTDVSELADP